MPVTDISGNPGKSDRPAQPDGSAPAIHAIIPAGGAGTRLWPLSRRHRPKFLLDLTGAGHSLLQDTVERLAPVTATTTVVTGVAHIAAVADQLPSIPRDNLLAEPSPRDSMAAIGLAAAVIARRHGRDAVVGSFAADHTVADRAAFADAVRQAALLAEQGWVVTIGIEATGPSTAFGYIHAGDPTDVPGAPDGRRVRGFTEKPDADTAAAYLATGDYRWNAGMFVVRAGVLLDHLAELRPQLAQGIEAIAAAWDAPEREEVLAERWPALEKIAIDHAIAEPVAAAGGVATVPVSMGWNDVGGFDALTELVPPRTEGVAAGAGVLDDVDGSACVGAVDGAALAAPCPEVRALDSDGALIASTSGRTVVLLGVPGAVVVDTPDALLVTTPEHAQDVKGVVDALKAAGREDLL
ncbi:MULTISPECIES: mannose-1-phosphate guanylyltransferase [Actinomyces]|uniref:Mannose-1-phosphate guanylyltransferase n=1 Tax=Actinomyces oris TaxID=544580 RepID=A0A1Q8VN81_9ACTO|nr:mannose-1-phosphate guanylyltransferase [Actinomyces oris]OLO49554.1 mannose-1-phosphate guanylyltransferase [Actinomyces oris]